MYINVQNCDFVKKGYKLQNECHWKSITLESVDPNKSLIHSYLKGKKLFIRHVLLNEKFQKTDAMKNCNTKNRKIKKLKTFVAQAESKLENHLQTFDFNCIISHDHILWHGWGDFQNLLFFGSYEVFCMSYHDQLQVSFPLPLQLWKRRRLIFILTKNIKISGLT